MREFLIELSFFMEFRVAQGCYGTGTMGNGIAKMKVTEGIGKVC